MKLVCIFIKYSSVFFQVTKLVCIFIKYRSDFFFVTKLIYFFLKYRSEFFSTTKQICIFIKYKSKNFSEKFFFLKIVDFEISKNELRVRLKYFLNMWCMHNRFELWIWVLFCKSHFFNFTKKKKTDLIFLNKIPFFILYKTYLIFISPILFFILYKNRSNFY